MLGLRQLILIPAVVLCVPFAASAQQSVGGVAPTEEFHGQLTYGEIPWLLMPEVDVDGLIAQDRANANRKDIPWRFGANIEVDIHPERDGQWSQLANGQWVWRLGIASPGAYHINLGFDDFYLPDGGRFYVSSLDGSHVIGGFTSANNNPDGQFATTLVRGEAIILEYLAPAATDKGARIHLTRVTHGYRNAYKYAAGGAARALGDSGACNNNVACPIANGWLNEVNSVVMLVSGGSGFCTGGLVNNTNNDGTPYVLTANHCYSNPGQWVFWFNYQSPTCANPAVDPTPDTVSGATLRARRADSDFCLVEINSAVPNNFNPFYAGWDNTGAIPTSTMGIHHPSGDIKKISEDLDPADISGFFGGGTDHWRVNDWDSGTTEGGSSGSPLFDQNHRVIGQLHGGSAACGNNLEDYYGRLSVSWDGNNAGSRLHDWLDPTASGVGVLDGYDPNLIITAVDAEIQAITTPVDGTDICSATVDPEVVLRNSGTDPLTAVDISYAIDFGPAQIFAWTGNLANGATANVVLPQLSPGPGPHTLVVTATNPNGGVDGNPANDSAQAGFTILAGSSIAPPLLEDFEAATVPPVGWSIDNPDNADTWVLATNASGFGNGSQSAAIDNFSDDFRGQTDSLILPPLDLRGATTALMTFDVAYARYDGTYSDQLTVGVSTTCGTAYSAVWSKSDTALATAPDDTNYFVPAANEWRTEVVDLTGYVGVDGVFITFDNLSGWGNALYIDNINVVLGGATIDNDGDGFTNPDGDCNDLDATIYPGAPELCDGRDNDCDSAAGIDEVDSDGDGVMICDGDCDDGDALVVPGATERCNGADDDCDGAIPADEVDDDGDGVMICGGDCADSNADIAPGNPEICNGSDDNCDGNLLFDEVDEDGDGVMACEGDCNDNDPDITEGSLEECLATTDNLDLQGSCGCNANVDHQPPLAALALLLMTLVYRRRQ